MDALFGLTAAQNAAVSHMDGPLLVLAGPGSGKTRVITHRIAYLIAQGVPAAGILALTFTNKAAEEMRNRLQGMHIPRGSIICTFHSLCARLLREFAGRAGLPATFSIYDQDDQKSVLRDILKARELDPQRYSPARILKHIGYYKSLRLSPSPVSPDFAADLPADIGAGICQDYQKRLDSAGALDFDDLLLRTAALLKDDAEIRTRLGRRYRYILVDEYQDTNSCQYRIARELSRDHLNLFVTGDPDQSIYGWRGADIENILAFEKDYPNAPVLKLEENFRSTPQILSLADSVIRENKRRKHKQLIARKPEGRLPRLYRYADEHEEGRGAAAWIRWMHEDQAIDYRRIAVFYRTNAMSRVLEESLIRAHVPYQIVKGLEFFERREVKDMLAYLRLLLNPADEVSLSRVINRPVRGIGDTTVRRLVEQAHSAGQNLWSVLEDPGAQPRLSASAASHIADFVKMIMDLRSLLDQPIARIMRSVYERTGLKGALGEEKNADAKENVEELIHSAMEFDQENPASGGLSEYIQRIALFSDADAFDERSGAVSLMTLHSAKGLEFAAVLIVGVEDGLIPHSRSLEAGRDREEERRLLFVGITRAERFLALSYAQTRTWYGVTRPAALSPFLKDLPGLEVIIAPFLTGGFGGADPTRAGSAVGLSYSDPSRSELGLDSQLNVRTGQRVRHPSIGAGLIEGIMPDGEKSRVVVQFDSGARLTLLLRFARLEPLD